MIQFTHATTRYTVTEANAPTYRALIDSGKPPKLHRDKGRSHLRIYPAFVPGMTTAEYVQTFQALNSGLMLTTHKYTHTDRAAPMLDATQPEVLEEIDPDYVEQPRQAKVAKRRPGAPELRLALSCILDIQPAADASAADLWLAIGEIRKLAQHMLEA